MESMEIMGIFKREAERILREAGYDLNVEEAKEGFGDFTVPCFSLSKKLKKKPNEIAMEIVKKLPYSEYFDKIEAVGGYINFWLSVKKVSEITLKSIIDDEIFQFKKKGKIIVEHTSANPTGPLHIGRARNPIIGDTISRILKKYGYDVKTHYFVNDCGKQVAILLWGIMNLKIEKNEKKCDHRYVQYYQKASEIVEKNIDADVGIRNLMKKYEMGDNELRKIGRKYIQCMMEGITESLKRINILVDEFMWESSLIEKAREIIKNLQDYMGEENGAFYLDLKKLGIEGEKDKVYIYRQDGTTLYFLRDIAYHIEKGKEAKNLVDVLGEDHKFHFYSLKRVMEILDPDIELHPLFYSFVRLPEGKMSTRRGRVVYLDDLIEEGYERVKEIIKEREFKEKEKERIAISVAVSAIRFSILNVQEEKPIVFKWENALNFEGESGPFILYTYARACGILRKVQWDGNYDIELVNDSQEIKIIKMMAKYHDIIEKASENLSPYIVAKYAYSLSSQFNQFYRDCPVIKAKGEKKNLRIAIVYSFRKIIKDLIEMLGMTPLEKM